jgi:hypothetical protein
MALRLTLTDGSGVAGLQAVFGAFIDTSIAATAADAAAAAASALAASGSASAASTSASGAAGSASAAAASASAAGGSASAAATSAGAAAGSATSAGTSATNANNSANAASGSASAAAGSATAAGTSATNAAASAANAAATLANALTKANNLSDVANTTTARANLTAAKSGANNDITSLAGLTTALSVPQGGSGAGTFSAHGVLLGEGTGPFGVATVGTAGRVLVDNGASDPSFQSIGVLSGRNVIVNGSCGIAQRPSFVASAGIGGYGGPDRYQASNSGSAGGQFTQSTGTINFGGVTKPAIVQTVNTAIASSTSSNYWSGIAQPIEGCNSFHLLGQAAVISFIFNTNVSGTYSVSLLDNGNANSFISSFSAVANTPIKITIPVAVLPTNLNVVNNINAGLVLAIGALNTGTFQSSTLNAWRSGGFISASGAANWGATAGNFISLAELQFEPGTVATPFEREHIEVTYEKCRRYYEIGALFMQSGAAAASGTTILYKTPKRLTPTLASSNIVYSSASGLQLAAGGVSDNSGFGVNFLTSAAAGYVIANWSATAEL